MMQGQMAPPRLCKKVTIVTEEGNKTIENIFRLSESADDKGPTKPTGGCDVVVVDNFSLASFRCLAVEELGRVIITPRDKDNKDTKTMWWFSPAKIVKAKYEEL